MDYGPAFLDARRRKLLRLLSAIGITAAYGFGLRAFLAGDALEGAIDAGFATLAVLNLWRLKKGSPTTSVAWVFQGILAGLLCTLTLSDDAASSGVVLWFYTFPLLAIFSTGWRRGGLSSLALGLVATGLVYYRNAVRFETATPLLLTARFFASYASVTLLTGFYDRVLSGTQRALSDNHENLHMVLSSLSEVIYSLDRQGRFVKFFQPLDHGAAVDIPDDFMGKPYADVLPPQAAEALAATLAKVERDGTAADFDYHFGEGSLARYFSAKVSPLKSAAGELVGFTVVARDVSEKRRLERELISSRQSSRLGRLAGGVAHEINNPLAAVQSDLRVLQVLVARLTPSPEQAKMLDILGRDAEAVSRASGIATAIREAYRPDRLHLVDLAKETDFQLSLLQREIKGRITIRKEFDPIPHVKAHGSDLGQILLNLLMNAVDAIPGEGEIVLRAWRTPLGLSLTVHDTGAGIAPDVLPMIFDPFFTTKEPGQGTGLGLSQSQELAERNGAKLSVAETAVGRGTTFKLDIAIGGDDEKV